MKTLITRRVLTVFTMSLFFAVAALNANATCVSPANRAVKVAIADRAAATTSAFSMMTENATSPGGDNSASTPTIAGMFSVILYNGAGPGVYDQQFDQWYEDGHEVSLSNSVPPALGNICLGIWKKTGPKSYKLRHWAWNFDNLGNTVGTFVLVENITLNDKGNGYTGTFVADSYDLNGNLLLDLHATGQLVGTRLNVD
jgi:hypothetical protein